MEIEKIKRKKIYEEVAEVLISKIKCGELNPGDKLPSVEQLAKNFQVGRSAIREALTELKGRDLIEIRQGEGTYIKYYDSRTLVGSFSNAILMNKGDLQQLVRVRLILETGVAKEAAFHRTEEDVEEIRSALQEMKDNRDNYEVEDEADIQFHMALANATHNPLLIEIMGSMSHVLKIGIKDARSGLREKDSAYAETVYNAHDQIYKAILKRKGNLAAKCMEEHLRYVEELLCHSISLGNPSISASKERIEYM